MARRLLLCVAASLLLIGGDWAAAATIDEVRARGRVICGIADDLAGFSLRVEGMPPQGLDIDYCRALAAAILNDPAAVEFVSLTARERFQSLQSGQVDVLFRKSAWTMARDTTLNLSFAATTYFDGQAFLARRSLGVTSALELSGAAICVQRATSFEAGLTEYFAQHRMNVRPVSFDTPEAAIEAYAAEQCDAVTADASSLYVARIGLAEPDRHLVLPEVISKEPLGAIVRDNDMGWFNLVKWVHFALVNAEELGVTRENTVAMRESPRQPVRLLLGVEGDFGKALGLGPEWAFNAIRAVGNYGEIFERNLGAGSRLAAPRGLNQLWSKGGMQYVPPIR